MKSVTKVVLILSLAMIVLGFGISTMAWAISGGNIGVTWNSQSNHFSPMHSSKKLEYGSYEPGEFQNIDIETDYGSVKLIPSDRYFVEYNLLTQYAQIECSVQGQTLVIRNLLSEGINGSLFNGFSWGGFNNLGDSAYLYVYYPKDVALSDATLKSSVGEVEIEGGTVTGTLDVTNNVGEVVLEKVSVGKLILETDTGEVSLKNVSADNLDATLAVGGFSAEDCTLRGVRIHAGVGGVELNGDITGDVEIFCDIGGVDFRTSAPRSDYYIEVKQELGLIEMDGDRLASGTTGSKDAPHRMTLECGMGGAEVHFGR